MIDDTIYCEQAGSGALAATVRQRFLIICGILLLLPGSFYWIYRSLRSPRELRCPEFSAELVSSVGCALCGQPPAGPVPRLLADSPVELTLRLRERLAADIPLYAEVVVVAGTRRVPWPLAFQRSPAGCLLGQGSTGSLRGLPPGRYELQIQLFTTPTAPSRLHPSSPPTGAAAAESAARVQKMPIELLPRREYH